MQENLFKNYICKYEVYLQHQWHPDKKHHESIKHTPAILNVGIIPLYKQKQEEALSQRLTEHITIYKFEKRKTKKVWETII